MDQRLTYIDNLRIFLVIMVLLAHLAITYGPVGIWYYYDRTYLPSTYMLAFFLSLTQSFLMGLFFMISGFFTPSSLKKKGAKLFLIDKFKKLGIPLLFYIAVIGPLLFYFHKILVLGDKIDFFTFYISEVIKKGYIDIGPLWFIQALLFFNIIYALIEGTSNKNNHAKSLKDLPSNANMALAIFLVALFTFVLRINFPIGTALSNLQIGLAPQYVFLYTIGIISYQNNWFSLIKLKKAVFWFIISVLTIFLWPLIIFFGIVGNNDISMIAGGLHIQSFAYSLWEITLSISIPLSLIYLFRQKVNFQNLFFKNLSKATYAFFLIHTIIILFISYVVRLWQIHPLLKFSFAALISIPLSFIIGHLMRKITFLRKIL